MLNIHLNGKMLLTINHDITCDEIQEDIHRRIGLNVAEYYLLQNGKIINENPEVKNGKIDIVLRTCGGKGGFGSMLRAIGAQIEKTTNREACRDLSGRRLRDINEEKRLKKWITQQTEREQEAAQRKQKKLERLCEKPKYEFKDKDYDNERSQLPEMVENAVIQGMEASCSNSCVKRKNTNGTMNAKKKPKLWIDADVDDISSSDGDSSDENDENSKGSSIDEDTHNVFKVPEVPELKEKSCKLADKKHIDIENNDSEKDCVEKIMVTEKNENKESEENRHASKN